jgi:hypothetical protein
MIKELAVLTEVVDPREPLQTDRVPCSASLGVAEMERWIDAVVLFPIEQE